MKATRKFGMSLFFFSFFLILFFMFFSEPHVNAQINGNGETIVYTYFSETHCSNGSCTETLYPDYVFFVNSSGKWDTINGTPEYGSFDGYDYRAVKGFYQAYYKSHLSYGDSIKFCSDGYCFTIQPSKLTYRNPSNSNDDIFSSPNTTNLGYPSENGFNWNDVFGSYDLNFQYLPTTLKENLILDNKPRTPATSLGNVSLVSMDIDTYIKYPIGVDLYFANGTKITGNILTSERLDFRNSTNNTLYSLPEPYAYDSNGSKIMLKYQILWNKKYNQNQQRLLWFYIKTPYDWLNSSEREYPIYIDPTVYYNFTIVNGNKAYGAAHNGGTVVSSVDNDFADEDVPTVAEIAVATGGALSNFTAGGYSALSTLNNGVANITSGHSNQEPFGKYNFTISQPSTTINWLNVTMSQKELVGAGTTEHCYYGIVNYDYSWDASGIYKFGNYMDGTTVVTRSFNFTSAGDEITPFIDGNNQLVMINWGTLMDIGDGCQIDWISVKLNYNSTISFNSPTNNNSVAKPNDQVNFTMNITTNNGDLSGYIFSSNFSDGTWRNSSFILLAGTQTSAIIWNTSTSTTAGTYGWRFYANTSTNYWNVSDIQQFTFSTRTLLVNWTNYNPYSQINATTCQVGSPCSYNQYNIFNASANVTCLTNPAGLSCGSITGGIMYNTSYTAYAFVNETSFDVIVGSSVFGTPLPNNCSTTWGATCDYNGNGGIDDAFDTPELSCNGTEKGNAENVEDVNISVISLDNTINATCQFHEVQRTGVFTSEYVFYYNTSNWTQVASWTIMNPTATTTVYRNVSFKINLTEGVHYVRCTIVTINATINDFCADDENTRTDNDDVNFTVYYNNPSSIGTLTHGQSYLLNYTINATDAPTKDYKLIFNFTSDNGNANPPENDTTPAYIRITTGGEAYVAISLTPSLSGGVEFGSQDPDSLSNISSSTCNNLQCNVTVSGDTTVNVDIVIKVNSYLTRNGGSETITTQYWNSSSTSQPASASYQVSASYDYTNKAGINRPPNSNTVWDSWVVIPNGKESGTYNNTIYFCACQTGTNNC